MRLNLSDSVSTDGIDLMIAQTLLSEMGADVSRWKTAAYFASRLELCPDNRVRGDKVLRRGTRHVVNRAANALRQGANALRQGANALMPFKRSQCTASHRPRSGPRSEFAGSELENVGERRRKPWGPPPRPW